MSWTISRGMRMVFGTAVLSMSAFGVRSAVAAPANAADTARSCPSGYNECICDGVTICRRTSCPICP